MQIGIICGSLRQASYNRIVAEFIPSLQPDVTFVPISIGELPLFNEDLEVGGDPVAVATFKEAIAAVDGVLIVTPEYNAGIPGVLKNALDWASRPAKTSVLLDKPVGIIGATPGGMGTAYSQLQLRDVLEQMQVPVLPFQKLLISQAHTKIDAATRTITDEKTKTYIGRYVQHYIDWLH